MASDQRTRPSRTLRHDIRHDRDWNGTLQLAARPSRAWPRGDTAAGRRGQASGRQWSGGVAWYARGDRGAWTRRVSRIPNRPEATREAFHDGWFRTGDVAVVED